MNVEIRKYSTNDYESLNILLKEAYGFEKKSNTIHNTELVADYNNEIVGYLTLNRLYDSVKDGIYYYINYVCVKEDYRNNHIATKLLSEAEKICQIEGAMYIELTSSPMRIAAQKLYEKKGFKKRDTNVFRKELI